MKSKIKIFSLIAISCLFSSGPVIAAVDVDHLNNARASVTAKHYHQGYVQFKKMAGHGCPFSQCIVGIMHQYGMGVKKSASRALYWFQRSAQQGFADAELRLGMMYYRGDGVGKDLHLAKKWLTLASEHGAQEAKETLARIPGENIIANKLTQVGQNAVWTVDNIRQSWQGYTEITNQLDQLTATAGSK